MDMKVDPVEVAVDELKDSRETDDGKGVVLETAARIDGETHETLIEVKQADAPAVAVALMNVTADPDVQAGEAAAELPPALRCLAAGVLHVAAGDGVRLHLQLDSGQVLPLEMDTAAAHALVKGLTEHLSGR